MQRSPEPSQPCAALPANLDPKRQLPEWQRRRVQLISELCAEIHQRIDRGETMRAAAAAVSLAALARNANAGIPRCPLSAQSLIRFYYLWLEGPEFLQQNFGGKLPSISEADALEFLNWLIGRRARSFGPTWREFCEHHRSERAQERTPDVRDWFARLRQRIARCEARARNGGCE